MANLKFGLIKNSWNKYHICFSISLGFFFISISFIAFVGSGLCVSNISSMSDQQLFTNDFEFDFSIELEQYEGDSEQQFENISYFSIIMPLYSKLNSSTVLSNLTRADIYAQISVTPGITLGSLTHKLKLRTGTLSHHLRILEREGYIKSRKTGKFRRYYKMSIKPTGFNEIQDQIIHTIKEHPGMTQAQIGRELNLSRQLVNYHIKELISLKVLRSEKIGNKCICFQK